MKNLLLLCLLFLLVSNIPAQTTPPKTRQKKSTTEFTVEWADAFKLKKKETLHDIIHDDGEYIYAVTKKEVGRFILVPVDRSSVVKFNNDLEIVKKVACCPKEKNLEYRATYYLKGRIIILSTKHSRNGTLELFGQKLNTDLEPDGKRLSLGKIKGKRGKSMVDYSYDNYKFCISNDSNKLGVVLFPDQKGSEDKAFMIKVFDADLNELFAKPEKLNVPSKDAAIKEMRVNNDGDAFLLIRVTDKNGLNYFLKEYSADGTENKTPLNLSGKFVSEYQMVIDSNGNLRTVIPYGEDKNSLKGLMYNTVEPSGEIVSSLEFHFPPSMTERIDKIQKDGSKDGGLNTKFKITEFMAVSDASTYTILEKSSNSYGKDATYRCDGIIVVKMDSSDQVLWSNYIPKIQYSKIPTYFGHTLMINNNKLLLFYNDDNSNSNYDIVKAVKAPKRMDVSGFSLMMVEFNEAGRMKRTLLGNAAKLGSNIKMSSTQTSPNRMLIYAATPNLMGGIKKLKYGFVNFK